MNWVTSKDPTHLFTNILICSNVNYDGVEAQSRGILANDKYKKRENGQHTDEVTFKSEQERVEKLKDHFGIELSPEEIEGIKGRRSAMEIFDPQNIPIDIFTAFG